MPIAVAEQRDLDRSVTTQDPGWTDPVRVLHVIPSLSIGGMECAMLRLIRHSIEQDDRLHRRRRLVHSVCVLQAEDDEMLNECRSLVRTWVLGKRKRNVRLKQYGAVRRLRRAIRCFRPDVVHARSTGAWFDATAATLRYKDVRLLLSFHGKTDVAQPSWRRRMLNRWTTSKADAVLTVSRDAARMMHDEWAVAIDKLHTIPNGVDTQHFRPADNADEVVRIRRQLGLRPTDHIAICVANLLPIKGIDVLLRAWRQVVMADRQAHLLLVGDGPLRSELEQLTAELQCTHTVRFLGHTDRAAELLRSADLFVLPSRYESCSNATLEAMASGLPVVASDVGGMRELVTPNTTGWLVPSESPGDLAHTLLTVLIHRSIRERIGQAARHDTVNRFSIDTCVEDYAALYRQLTDRELTGHRVSCSPANRLEGVRCAG